MKKDALFEIGVEELPARFIVNSEKSLYELTEKWLNENRIEYESIDSFSTPRRLAVRINGLANKQESLEETLRGPSLKIAKDDAGEWTKAAQGFVRGQGKTVEDLYIQKEKDTEYIFVDKVTEGKETAEILQTFGEVVEKIPLQAQMRWGNNESRFIRPIRWLVGLYGEETITFTVANVKSSNQTFGHRFLGKEIEISVPAEYENDLYKQSVIVRRDKREKMIQTQLKDLEMKNDFTISVDEDLLGEVTDLVEFPTAFVGNFNKSYLQMPEEILITSMKEHQRYFPTYREGQLQPYFVAVRNGNEDHIEHVQLGNERVLKARLNDAEFFYNEDLTLDIDILVDRLKNVVFQEELGTYYDKIERIKNIALFLNDELSLNIDETDVKRAALISKFDLETNIVHEFTELQGIMGSYYAEYFGENQSVSHAIKEQYLPKSANGDLPQTDLGSLLAISDKIDTIIGCIMAGLIPTGSQDPYGLRREAIGLLRILFDRKWNVSIEKLINQAKKQYPNELLKNELEIEQFIKQRIHYLLSDFGIEHDVIEAVTDRAFGQMRYMVDRAKLLSEKRHDDSFKRVEEALVRVLNLVKDEEKELSINTSLFETDSERELYEKYNEVKDIFTKTHHQRDAKGSLSAIAGLTEQINTFFEHNMVMTDDEAIKLNRLALLTKIRNLVSEFANLRLIEWKQSYDR